MKILKKLLYPVPKYRVGEVVMCRPVSWAYEGRVLRIQRRPLAEPMYHVKIDGGIDILEEHRLYKEYLFKEGQK